MKGKDKKFNKHQRYFTETVRKSIVKEVEGGLAITEASRKYGISKSSIYRWLELYSLTHQKSEITLVMHKEQSNKYKELEKELKHVYELLGRTQTELNFLNKVIELASEDLKLDIKKNFGSKPSYSSSKTKQKK